MNIGLSSSPPHSDLKEGDLIDRLFVRHCLNLCGSAVRISKSNFLKANRLLQTSNHAGRKDTMVGLCCLEEKRNMPLLSNRTNNCLKICTFVTMWRNSNK